MRSYASRRFAILVVSALICCAGSLHAVEVDPQNRQAALSPQESLKKIVVDPGLKLELVAHEPNVMSPVAVRFDEDGRMWVVEMRDYPTGPTKEFPERSRVSILTDKDGDGFFETATVFADKLPFATGVQPWKSGAFVTMAGKVVYMKDTNGDDKADVTETWYTGFVQGNEQLRANHPRLALDNHIYIANGLLGGTIQDARKKDAKPLSINGMDFRFDPHTGDFEGVSGMGQFGLTFDDVGNRFVCTNRNPVIHIVLEDRFLKKNRLAAIGAVVHDVAKAAGDSRLYSLGSAWVTSNLHQGTFTAACGVEVFRGDGLSAEYYGNVFTCDPTARVIHREIMKPDGVTFVSTRMNEEKEFFASSDEWCGPVNLETGPDGAMYVVDMYRQIIEHPHWMPEELQKRRNLRAGHDRGRIYRIVRSDLPRRKTPQFSSMPSSELVAELARVNAWRRETAQRLLIERGDATVGPQLEEIAMHHRSPLVRVHALRVLQSLKLLSDQLLLRAMDDRHPRVIEQAILIAESRVNDSEPLRERVTQLAQYNDARVRFFALLVATPLPTAPKSPADRWELDAVKLAARDKSGDVLAGMLQHADALKANIREPKQFIVELARQAAASKDAREYLPAVAALLESREYERVGLTGFLADMVRSGVSLNYVRSKLGDEMCRRLDHAFDGARQDAENTNQQEAVRSEAIDLLAFRPDAGNVLTQLALNDANQVIRLRAIAALAKSQDFKPWSQLLANMSAQTPAEQRAILDGVLASEERTLLLLDEIEAGRIKATVVDQMHAPLLLENRDMGIKSRARRLMASAVPADRAKVLAEYQAVLKLKAEPARGRAIFEKRCAICHKIGDIGEEVAPDISDSREKLPEQILTDIIQPNRAIDSNYFSYVITTTDGRVHTGVLAAETSTSVTLRQQEGKSQTLRRDEIEAVQNSGISFMPEGLEKDIPPQDMADLISFIKNWRYLDSSPSPSKAKPQAGN